MMKYIGLFIMFFGLSTFDSTAQCSMFELSMTQKESSASDIFEGKVLSKVSFWNAPKTLIYTSCTIEVYKVFKGNIDSVSKVEVIIEGGTVGNYMQSSEPNLMLEIDDVGIFMAVKTTPAKALGSEVDVSLYECYGASQGFFKYDAVLKSAIVPFKVYPDIEADLYTEIVALTGKFYRVIGDFNTEKTVGSTAKAGGAISSFSPSTISGGTFSVLTINGSGFGATQGSSVVAFKNANTGGTTYMNPLAFHYVSWSDTKIEVMVPAKTASGVAGTGTFRVIVGGTTITSSTSLTVNYSEANTSGSTPYQTDFIDRNGTGGITWNMHTDVNSNTAAKNAFNRALQTWIFSTGINWNVGATTTLDEIAFDSVSVVRFDNGGELPAGTLARCHYYWQGCGFSTADVWSVYELDMVIDDGTAWGYGPASPSGSFYDFESVMLHELGHGHQLGHVINSSDAMNYSVQPGTTHRALTVGNIAGGEDVMSRSGILNSCGNGPMVVSVEEKNVVNSSMEIYPNPSSGIFTITFDEIPEKLLVYNSLGDEVAFVAQGGGSIEVHVDLSNLPDGVYCIVAPLNGESFSKKVILTR